MAHTIWRHVETCRFAESGPKKRRKQITQKQFLFSFRLLLYSAISNRTRMVNCKSLVARAFLDAFCAEPGLLTYCADLTGPG